MSAYGPLHSKETKLLTWDEFQITVFERFDFIHFHLTLLRSLMGVCVPTLVYLTERREIMGGRQGENKRESIGESIAKHLHVLSL